MALLRARNAVLLIIAILILPGSSAQDYAALSEKDKLDYLKSIGIITERSDYIDGNSIDPMRLRGPIKLVGSPTLGVILGESGASLDVSEFSGSFYVLNNVRAIARNADLAVRGGTLVIEAGRLNVGGPLEASGTIGLTRRGGGIANRRIAGKFTTLEVGEGIVALTTNRMVLGTREMALGEPAGLMNVVISGDRVYLRGRSASDRIQVLHEGILQLELEHAPWMTASDLTFLPSGAFDHGLANGLVGPGTMITRYSDGRKQEAVASADSFGSMIDTDLCKGFSNCATHSEQALALRAQTGNILVMQFAPKRIGLVLSRDRYGLPPMVRVEGITDGDRHFSLWSDGRGLPLLLGPNAHLLNAMISGPDGAAVGIRDGVFSFRCSQCESESVVGKLHAME